MTTASNQYAEKVYAGILGKIIGVYIGRPFEGWTHERIEAELGEIRGYVAEKLGQPLIVTDDDISGTFTFFRALQDYGYSHDLSSEQIGQSWLNYIIEDRTILWWGGMGMSTEHTAFLRLKSGIPAPESGSMATNGRKVAEQIGAQIFIDAWGLVSPGDADQAAKFAHKAGSVSHDGESVHAAVIIAAMVALAFDGDTIDELIDGALAHIPTDCLIARVIADVRTWHASGISWREAFGEVRANYGYDKFGGACHVVPNHALVILALLYGNGDFTESQMIVNTCGWDTDCNAANVGCILGVLNGLSAFEAEVDWRGPIRDRMYLPTADGGRCITDAVQETYEILKAHAALAGESFPDRPRFDFSLPGSVQGFSTGSNVGGQLEIPAGRSLTPTFTPPDALNMPGYSMVASPTLYPGQTVRFACDDPSARLVMGVYDEHDRLSYLEAPDGGSWTLPDTNGFPIAEIGIRSEHGGKLDWLSWDGAPSADFQRVGGSTWRSAWVNGVSQFNSWPNAFSLIQNEGTGLISTGTREWTNCEVSADLRVALCDRAGIAARVQGMRRYYGLFLCRDGFARLIRVLDGETVLAEVPFAFEFDASYSVSLRVEGASMVGRVGELTLHASDDRLEGGGVALLVSEGRVGTERVRVRPI